MKDTGVERMPGLVEHAQRELALSDEDPVLRGCLLAVVGAFGAFPHSSGSWDPAMDLLGRLLRGEALTPLTFDPEEWIDRAAESGCPMWQCARDSRAFSEDGGLTYWLVGHPKLEARQRSVDPPHWIKRLRGAGVAWTTIPATIAAYMAAGPLDHADRVTLDTAEDPADRVEYMTGRWGDGAALAALLYQPSGGKAI